MEAFLCFYYLYLMHEGRIFNFTVQASELMRPCQSFEVIILCKLR